MPFYLRYVLILDQLRLRIRQIACNCTEYILVGLGKLSGAMRRPRSQRTAYDKRIKLIEAFESTKLHALTLVEVLSRFEIRCGSELIYGWINCALV
jgi:hypothetical protein